MRKKFGFFLLILLVLPVVLVACGQDDDVAELPTAVPLASVPTSTPTPIPPTPEPEIIADVAVEAVAQELIDWPPQVVFSSPAPGEDALLDGAITIRFDQPMDQDSVESAFNIATKDDRGVVAGKFSWPRDDTLLFTPEQLQREQTYAVTIDDTAVSTNGFPLEIPVELELQTIGFLEVSQVIPADGTQGVLSDSAITVLFNRPVVPLVATTAQGNLPDPLIFDPPVAGMGEWISTSIYRFMPDDALAGATTYNVRIDNALTDFTGAVLSTDVSWRFTTIQPDVVTIAPENGSESIRLDEPIVITFNMPMDRDSTETAVSIRSRGEAPNPTFDYGWSDSDRVLTLKPQDPYALETTYQVTVGRSARAASGQSTLVQEGSAVFSTVRFPAVISTIPTNGQLVDQWQRGFSVRFSAPMDPATLEDRIRIVPEPEGTVRYFYNEYSFELSVDFNFELNSRYAITVPRTAADLYGNTIEEDYFFNFTTPGRQPIASLNLPGSISQVSTNFVTQVDVLHVNVSQIDVELYEVGLPLGLMNRPYELREYRPAASPLRQWNVPIETLHDEVSLLPIPLADGGVLAPGVYLLTVDTPETDADVAYWQNQRHLMIVADTNVVVKEMFDGVHVWVTDLGSGTPAPSRGVTLYNEQGVQMATAVTDNNGFATFNSQPLNSYLEGVTVVTGSPGLAGFGIGSSGWNTGVGAWQFGIPATTSDQADTFAYIYTDRPIYRPGDTIYFKGIVRDANYGRYNLPAAQTLELNLYQSTFSNEQALNELIPVDVRPNGTFDGSFVIPDAAGLGRYELAVPLLDYTATRSFSVAEYRRPEFLVNVVSEQPELLRGEAVDVVVEAAYFFGGAASDLEVDWTIYETGYQPAVSGPYYAFGDAGDYFYADPGIFFGGGGGGLGNFILNGTGTTDRNGRLTITLPADLLDDIEAGSRTINVEANINDLSNFPVTGRTSVTFHAAEAYVGVSPQQNLITAGNEAVVDVHTVDWDGNALATQDVELVFYRREWEPTRTIDYGIYYTSWEAVDTEVARQQIRTDANGDGSGSFVPSEGGTYLAVATVTDRGKRTNISSSLMWVIDSRYAGWRIDPKERRIDLVPDLAEYQPGETAQILVQSPFTSTVNAWLTIERGSLIEQRVITLNGSSEVLNIPISADYAPNVFVSVAAIKGVEPGNSENPHADIRLGITELVVSPAQLALNVELVAQEDMLTPGDTAVYTIQVTDYQGNPVQADLSLALVDLAVLTLKADNAPPILEAFYTRQPYRGQVGSGLFISGEGVEPEIPIEAGGLGGGGGDFAAEEALSRAAGDEDDDVRQDFPDTAFWEANIRTDGNGRAAVEIPLPDTLTTWRLSSKAVTEDTRVGQSAVDIVTSLPLLLRPVTPRFLTVGDVLQIGTIVNNNTDTAVDATVRITADGFFPDSLPAKEVSVPANGQRLVQWEVLVQDVSFVDLTFRVEGGGYADATRPSFGVGPNNQIPVYRYNAADTVATSGVLDEAGRRVEAILLPDGVDRAAGTVDVRLSPSLAAAVLESLQANNDRIYNSNCAYSVADRLISNAVTAQALQTLSLNEPQLAMELDGLVQTAVSQLESLVLNDGGWGWCFSRGSNLFMTTHVLYALVQADLAGYVVSSSVMDAATGHLFNQVVPAETLSEPWQINRQIFMLYVLALRREPMPSIYDGHFEAHRTLMDPYAKALLAMSYQEYGGDKDNIQSLVADLNDTANLSATGAHWEDSSRDFRNLSSDVRGTAVVIQALTQLDSDNQLLPQAVRWLMSARTVSVWPTTHETAWSIQALANWMAATSELDANFAYDLNVNLQPVSSGAFTSENITLNRLVSIPVSDLVAEDVNFVDVQRGGGDGRLYYTLYLNSAIDASTVTAVDRGISIQRQYFDAGCDPEQRSCGPIDGIEAGQQVRVELTIVVENDLLYAIVEDPIPAGAEGIDPNLETSASGFAPGTERSDLAYRYGYWGWWFFNRIEFQDEQVAFFAEFLPAGTYQYTYFLQTTIPGIYQVRPAFARQEFFSEVNGRSNGMLFTIFE
ncbi:MAG: hypothetical protein GY943_29400 [Chloroflexi bacterium]|nr:hypothetical protein [Chloroflexota bacterium]